MSGNIYDVECRVQEVVAMSTAHAQLETLTQSYSKYVHVQYKTTSMCQNLRFYCRIFSSLVNQWLQFPVFPLCSLLFLPLKQQPLHCIPVYANND